MAYKVQTVPATNPITNNWIDQAIDCGLSAINQLLPKSVASSLLPKNPVVPNILCDVDLHAYV